jgi:MFS transporter, DHA2 family, methylenomycin A resistance protein
MLIAARLLQGVGAALFMPSSLSLLTESFPDRATRTKLVGIWSAVIAAAAGSGPVVGGVLVAHFGWRSIFYLNLPVGLLGTALTIALLRASPRRARPFDIGSHSLIMAALGGLSYLLIEGPALGWFSSWRIIAAALVGLLAFAFLLRRELTASHPVIPRPLAGNSHFWALNGMGFLVNFVLFGEIFIVSLFLQQARGATALATGVGMLPIMCVAPVVNFTSGHLVNRWGGRRIMMVGLFCAAIGAMTAAAFGGSAPYWLLVAPIALCNAGLALAIPAMTAGVMHEAGQADANVGAATLNANRQIGALAGVAVVGIVVHLVGDWTMNIRISFAAFTICLITGFLLIHFGAAPSSPPVRSDPNSQEDL